jgi:hypothetical protein
MPYKIFRIEPTASNFLALYGGKMSDKPITFNHGKFDTYKLTATPESIQLYCYLSGSITGGSGTECAHTITGTNIETFLAALKCTDTQSLNSAAPTYTAKQWQFLHATKDYHPILIHNK